MGKVERDNSLIDVRTIACDEEPWVLMLPKETLRALKPSSTSLQCDYYAYQDFFCGMRNVDWKCSFHRGSCIPGLSYERVWGDCDLLSITALYDCILEKKLEVVLDILPHNEYRGLWRWSEISCEFVETPTLVVCSSCSFTANRYLPSWELAPVHL